MKQDGVIGKRMCLFHFSILQCVGRIIQKAEGGKKKR